MDKKDKDKIYSFKQLLQQYPETVEYMCMEEMPYKMIAFNIHKLKEMRLKKEDIKLML